MGVKCKETAPGGDATERRAAAGRLGTGIASAALAYQRPGSGLKNEIFLSPSGGISDG